jgi:predicted membrane-bound spermidine synthase
MLVLNIRLIYLYLIFVTGGVVLSLELITSRVLAPFFGVSLYIWTAILSITLTFLALGYQFGGWLTAKIEEKHHDALLLSIPILSSLFVFLSCLLYPVIFPKLSDTGLILGSFIGSFILLAFPLVLLSSVNPILIALLSQSSKDKDSGAGFVFFVSTFGSVAGVLITALLIIPNVTNYSAMLFNGIFLGLFTLTAHFLTKKNRSHIVNTWIGLGGVAVILLCFSLLLWKNFYLGMVTSNTNTQGERFEILSEYPSHYGNLKVVGVFPKEKKELSKYILLQDGVSQGVIGKDGNSLVEFSYNLEKLAGFAPQAKSALILGFGAGHVPRKLRQKGMRVNVVEINPDTLSAAKQYFNYTPDGTNFFFEDARIFVKNCEDEYDIIVLDLFHGDGIPEHVTSQEFFRDIEKCLSDEGVLLSNVWMALGDQQSKMSLLATNFSVFGDVHLFHTEISFKKDDKLRFTNAYIVAPKIDHSLKIPFDLSDVPKAIRVKVFTTLKSHKKLSRSSFEGYHIIRDNGNAYSYLFAEPIMRFRKNMVSQTPSRILIN